MDFEGDVAQIATSILRETGRRVSRAELAAAMIEELDALYAALKSGDTSGYLDEYRRRCVTIGRCFIGESMFSLVPNASKIALIFLADFMREHGGKMIDCQLETPHLKSMGGKFISYEEYMKILRNA